MTDKNLHNGIAGDDTFDADLEQELKGAYEAMNPTPEQESRMLAALLEAQAERAGRGGPEAAADERPASAATAKPADSDGAPSAEEANAPASPQANRARGFKAWMVAVPLAACLAVGAVVVGTSDLQGAAPNPSNGALSAESQNAPASNLSGKSEAQGNTVGQVEVLTEEMAVDGYAPMDAAAEANGSLSYMGGAADARGDVVTIDGPAFNTEEYNKVEERGFVSTKSSPLSTVSADVDTASYCNVRRMINDGYALSDIPSGAVRIEEMLNYFTYDYAAPTGKDLFSMNVQSAPCPWNKDTQLLVMGFAAAPESKAASKGSNLVFLIDVSGSMGDSDKLALLQDSFTTLLDNLGANDRVSIVTYSSGEEIVLEGASGDDDKAIMRAIYKLNASGSTNGEAGLRQAYEVAERNRIDGGVNRIIMASDGDLNVGMTSEADLYEYVDKQRETGIYLSVLGFGAGNYKDNKMETLADHGNGSYHYIDCIEEAERVLKENLTANLVPFADDVKVQVEFNPSQVKAYRLIGYENRALADEDFRNDEVDAGDVGPGAQFTVAYEVVLADSKMNVDEPDLKYGGAQTKYANDSKDWLTCTMRYHVFDGNEMREQQLAVDAGSVAAQPSADWNFAAAVIEFGMIARDSKYAGTSSADSVLDLLTGDKLNDEREGFRKLVAKAS